MRFNVFKNTVLFFGIVMISCAFKGKDEKSVSDNNEMLRQAQHDITESNGNGIIAGANQTEAYLPLLKGKRVGIVANQTTVIFKQPKAKSQITHI